MRAIAWINGDLKPVDEIAISPLDHGFTVGDGVFETLQVAADGRPFALTRHLRRLRRSGEGLGIRVPDDRALRKGIEAVVAANDEAGSHAVGRLRITITSGPGSLGSGRGDSEPTVVLLCGPPSVWEPRSTVVVAPWTRNERGAAAGLKTTSYAENAISLAWAHARGADEALLPNTQGMLCEGTGTNVFVESGGRLLTPPLAAGCLAGITRELLLELGNGAEDDVRMAELPAIEEAFLTSSTRDVHPIASLDGRVLSGCGGPATVAAQQALADLQARNPDP